MLKVETKVSVHIDGEDAVAFMIVCRLAAEYVTNVQQGKIKQVDDCTAEERAKAARFMQQVRKDALAWQPKAG